MPYALATDQDNHQRRMSSVSLENLQSFCRICLAHLDHQTVKYNIHQERHLSKWILSCTTTIALPHDNFPQFVCHQCYGKLRLFNEFRSMSLQSLQFLHNILRPNKRQKAGAESHQLKSVEQKQVLSHVYGNSDWQEFHYGCVEPLFHDLNDMAEQMCMNPIGLCTNNREAPSEYATAVDIGHQLPAEEVEIIGQESGSSFDPCSQKDPSESPLTPESVVSDNEKDGKCYEGDKDGNVSDNSVDIKETRVKKRKKSKNKSKRITVAVPKLKVPGVKSCSSTSTSMAKKKPTTMFQCDQCPRRCFNQHAFDAHKRTHDGLKQYVCTECNRSFSKAIDYRVHRREAHPPKKQEIVCTAEGCGKKFERETTCKAHRRNHTQGAQPQGRTKQMEVNHIRVPKIHICDQCGCTFRNATKLKEHSYKHAPPDDYPYRCEQCDKRFAKKSSYNEHLLRHAGIKKSESPYCGMKKTTKHEVRTHINNHTKERQWPCQQCPMVFSSVSNLGMHDRVAHKCIKQYECRYCGQSFSKSDTLKHHEMRHTAEKPHSCEVCPKRFIQSVALRAHMKTQVKSDKKKAPKTSK